MINDKTDLQYMSKATCKGRLDMGPHTRVAHAVACMCVRRWAVAASDKRHRATAALDVSLLPHLPSSTPHPENLLGNVAPQHTHGYRSDFFRCEQSERCTALSRRPESSFRHVTLVPEPLIPIPWQGASKYIVESAPARMTVCLSKQTNSMRRELALILTLILILRMRCSLTHN
jgi:hypothetical protein